MNLESTRYHHVTLGRMSLPADSKSETIYHAVESLKRSDRPLTAKEILELIPPPSRVSPRELDQLLAQALPEKELAVWPSARAKASRYWTRSAEVVAESALKEVLTDSVLTSTVVQEKLRHYLPGFPAKRRQVLVSQTLARVIVDGKLFKYPKNGRSGFRYSAKPAPIAVYTRQLKKDFDALVGRLGPAGIGPEQILGVLRGDVKPEDLAQRIVAYLSRKQGGVGIGELRENIAPNPGDQTRFDNAVLSLWKQRRVYLDRHDFPQGMSEADRNHYLIPDGQGNYYVMIGLRDSDAESLPQLDRR